MDNTVKTGKREVGLNTGKIIGSKERRLPREGRGATREKRNWSFESAQG